MRQQHVLTLVSDPAGGAAVAQQRARGIVGGWNRIARRALHDGAAGVQGARTLAILHTCLYNAWAAYDDDARQTVHGVAVRLPRAERGTASKAAAMSHAAHGVLVRQVPAQAALFDAHMRALGLDPSGAAAPFSPAGIGQAQADAMLDACRLETGAGAMQVERRPAAPWYALADRLAGRGGHDDERDVLLFFVLANALADAGPGAAALAPGSSLLRGEALPGGADPGAAGAEVLRRMVGQPFANGMHPEAAGAGQEAGRQVAARVFDKARRCWAGRL